MRRKKTQPNSQVEYQVSQLGETMTTAVARVDKPENFRGIRRLTRDVATITRLGEAIVLAQSEVFTIEMKSQFSPHDVHTAYAVNCYDCLRGEEYTLVCGAVLASTFRQVPDGIEGKYFAIRSGEIPEGKRYRKTEVVQLERVEYQV